MAENFKVEVLNTAGYNSWQNVLCERNHAAVDDCVQKILADNPGFNLEITIVWAINASTRFRRCMVGVLTKLFSDVIQIYHPCSKIIFQLFKAPQ